MKHLWEVDHPYYCSLSNYFCNIDDQPTEHFNSWEEYITARGDEDLDMNLLFRFDWMLANEDTELDNEQLYLFYIGQRKGIYSWVTIDINRKDEPDVVEFLQKRLNHLKQLWSPLESK